LGDFEFEVRIVMLKIRYSLNEAIDISGTRKDIELLRQEILKFLLNDDEKIQIDVERNISSEPWCFVAKGLKIIQNDKPAKVSISDNKVIKIEGSKENLKKFTSFLVFDENAVSGQHSHYEYYEGHKKWVSPDSFPLIIGIK
jgi:hypothetical protein